jgi:hypothetical protein
MRRNRTVVSSLGHSVEFAKDMPTYVPPELYQEVMAAGAVPEEEGFDPVPAQQAQGVVEPTDPFVREAALFAAFEALSLRGKREDFTASGTPHPKAMEKELGWKVSNKERDTAWTLYRTRGE